MWPVSKLMIAWGRFLEALTYDQIGGPTIERWTDWQANEIEVNSKS